VQGQGVVAFKQRRLSDNEMRRASLSLLSRRGTSGAKSGNVSRAPLGDCPFIARMPPVFSREENGKEAASTHNTSNAFSFLACANVVRTPTGRS
jgi:hypothetical protein